MKTNRRKFISNTIAGGLAAAAVHLASCHSDSTESTSETTFQFKKIL